MRFPRRWKQRNSQRRFQIAHLLGDAGLRNTEAVGRAAETPGLRDCEEITQVANLKRVVSWQSHIERIIGGLQFRSGALRENLTAGFHRHCLLLYFSNL